MKKLMICIALVPGLILQAFNGRSQAARISEIKNDPDWKIIANIQDDFVNKFIAAKVDLNELDLNDEGLVLNTVGIEKEDYLKNVELVRSAGARLVKKYELDKTDCSSCLMEINAKNDVFKSVMAQFKADPGFYSRFRTESLGIGTNLQQQTCCCCGFRFYACCALCAATIEAFPLYLACCTICFHTQCCGNS